MLTFAFASPFDLEEMGGGMASCALVALIYAGDVLASEDWTSYEVEVQMGFEVTDHVASFPKMKLLLLPSRQTVEHIAKRPEKYAGHSYVACLLLLSFLYR